MKSSMEISIMLLVKSRQLVHSPATGHRLTRKLWGFKWAAFSRLAVLSPTLQGRTRPQKNIEECIEDG